MEKSIQLMISLLKERLKGKLELLVSITKR